MLCCIHNNIRGLVCVLACIFLFFTCAGTQLACSKENTSVKIVAVINKDIIIESDIQNRIRLIQLTSGMKNADFSPQLRAQVLNALMDENLQIFTANSRKIVVSEKDLDQSLENMAKENGMTVQQMVDMLKNQNISKETLVRRIKAQMSWVRYVRAMYGFLSTVSDQEVDQELEKIKNQQQQRQYALAEIVLLVSSPSHEGRIKAEAQRIVGLVRTGNAQFSAMARQFSQDPTSVAGGDLGWVGENQLDPAIQSAVQRLSTGQISDPIRTSSGYKIVLLRGKKNPGEADPDETIVQVCQVVFNVSPETPQPEIEAIGPQVEEIMGCNGCEKMREIATRYNLKIDASPPLAMGQVPDQLREMIRKVPVGKAVQPVMTQGGLITTMVCNRKTPVWTQPTRDQVMTMIEQSKLSKLANREMMKLRASAFIEIKDSKLSSDISKN